MATILIIDDDIDVRLTLCAGLEAADHTVRGVGSAEEGLAVLATDASVELLVLDVMMPQKTGWEVLEAVRSSPATVELPVLMLSALGDSPNRARGLKLGADDFLAKPFDPEELIARVEALLRRRDGSPKRGFAGSFAEHRAPEVVQLLAALGRSGRLTVWSASAERGFVDIAAGGWASAQFGAREGRSALLAIVALTAGGFEFVPLEPNRAQSGRTWPVDPILLEGAWLEDELGRLPALEPHQRISILGTQPNLEEDYSALPWRVVERALAVAPNLEVAQLLEIPDAAPREIALCLALGLQSGWFCTDAGASQAGRPTPTHERFVFVVEDHAWSLLRRMIIDLPDEALGDDARRVKQRAILDASAVLGIVAAGRTTSLRIERVEPRTEGDLLHLGLDKADVVVAWHGSVSLLADLGRECAPSVQLVTVGTAPAAAGRWTLIAEDPATLLHLFETLRDLASTRRRPRGRGGR